jgi:hypothetical protein
MVGPSLQCFWFLSVLAAPSFLSMSHGSGASKSGHGCHWPFLTISLFPLQLALRGPAGPMGLTGRPGPMVSGWQV